MSVTKPFAKGLAENPFPGLRPFREEEEYLFFGRENQVDSMVDKLAATQFLTVVGGSGSGKSSLVNCGLRPALHGGLMSGAGTSWRMAQFRPGGDPIAAMAKALAAEGVLFSDFQAGGLTLAEIVDTTLRMSKLGLIDICEQADLGENMNLLVVVDQFEELFRYRQLGDAQKENEYGVSEEDAAFVNLLLEAKEQTRYPIYIVLTMRSDFLGDCAHFTGLAEAVNAGQYLVPRMTRDERRAAICGPIGVFGAEISPVLLTRLVNDVGDNPDQLSILQHALNRTWARWQHDGRTDRPLDLPHYESIGTMSHALDQHAEKAFADLNSVKEQQICEKIFKALTDKATDPRGVRRPTTLRDLCALAADARSEVAEVIEVFRRPSRSFLMPPAGSALEDETVIDISHESLMRVWERLKKWADEEARSARIYSRLAATAVLHDEGQAGLLHGPELQLALKWRDDERPNETWAKRYHPQFARAMAYLNDSRAARLRRRWMTIGVTVMIFAVLSGFLIWAMWEERLARQQAVAAKAAGAKDLLDTKPSRGLIAAIVSGDEARKTFSSDEIPSEIRSSYIEALQLVREGGAPRNAWSAHDGEIVTSVAMSDDGQKIVTGGWDGKVRVWTNEGKEFGIPLSMPQPGIEHVAISADGGTIVSLDPDGVWALDPLNGKSTSLPVEGKFTAIAMTEDGEAIALSGNTYDVLIDRNGKRLTGKPADRPEGAELGVSIAGDGQTVLHWEPGKVRITDRNGLNLWKTGTENEQDGDRDRSFGASSAAISRDGETIAIGYRNGYVRLFNKEGESLDKDPEEGSAHEGKVTCVAISADGATIVSGGEEGTVRIWNRQAKSVGPALTGHDGNINAVAITGDGKSIVSAGDDGIVRLWEVPAPEVPVKSYQGKVDSIVFGGDGKTVLAAGPDGIVHRLNQRGAQTEQVAMASGPVPTMSGAKVSASAWGPDGEFQIVGFSDGKLLRRNQTENSNDQPFGSAHDLGISAIAVSGDGRTIISGDEGGTIRLWDSGGQPIGHAVHGHDGRVASVALSGSGKTIITGGTDGKVLQWSAELAKLLRTLTVSYSRGPGETVAVSPDGDTIVSGSERGMMGIWDADGNVISIFKGHENNVSSLAFGPDQDMIVSADDLGTVRLWNRSGHHIGRPFMGSTQVTAVALNRDGTTLASGDASGNITVREIGLETFLQEACDWLSFFQGLQRPETENERKAAEIARRYWKN